jgi:hypothetical protein
MTLRWSGLAWVELALAGAIFAIGVPGTISAIHELSFTVRLDGAGTGENLGANRGEPTAQLDLEVPATAREGLQLAFALLSRSDDPAFSDQARIARTNRAAQLFREYLAEVPADGRAWAGLASAEILRGELGRGAAALRMSILTAPWSSSLVQWRCGMAIDLFRTLDDEERELMKGQFRVAAQRAVAELVKTVRARNGTRIARIFLASSPDELIKFEAELARSG